MDNETEDNARNAVEEGKTAIEQATNLLNMMSALRGKLNIQDGAGQRYLEKIKPDMAQLKEAETEILSNYSGKPATKQKKRRNNMMSALHRHGRA
ncbi:hypothetical protein GZ77_01870 [Endozoicomonas montiporae]|uniref:Uncharacterized protein n=2 Tax=Endozoicomonas montiporae TaxID=1027273 RepID=A0A081NAE7_9GAMM|nr:hypothetical protein [Endozoicomonas montiporae]AMO56903.1 hypothetical protein EZMO1_2857 [Endozoicomonas montiporae CL-33]KEQ15420.1 hypothetical protein GZ77_01870 [Endozoicomonas montiporae]